MRWLDDLVKWRELELALSHLYSADTCCPGLRDRWSADNPTLGHCIVVALIVQDHFGGEIVYDKKNRHYWNRINGMDVDFTRDQFRNNEVIQETRICQRSDLLKKSKVLKRYQLLKEKVENYLSLGEGVCEIL